VHMFFLRLLVIALNRLYFAFSSHHFYRFANQPANSGNLLQLSKLSNTREYLC
jgi:hypothetical protein